MKKTKSVSLDRMRKTWRPFTQNTLSIAVVSAILSGCSDKEEAVIYREVNDCLSDNPDNAEFCKAAYEHALEEAARTGPKYENENQCIQDFGFNNCVQVPSQPNFFMPAMAGFMFARMLNNNRPYYSQPMYTSNALGNTWVTSDGRSYGNYGDANRYKKIRINVDQDRMKPKPTTRTISRGGFGSTVSAKSSWGKSKSSSGWGG